MSSRLLDECYAVLRGNKEASALLDDVGVSVPEDLRLAQPRWPAAAVAGSRGRAWLAGTESVQGTNYLPSPAPAGVGNYLVSRAARELKIIL